MTLKMVELTAENGKPARHMDMASVPDQKDKLVTKALGTTASNSAEFMFGLTAIALRVNGSMDADTDLALNIEENGLTKASGKKALKRVTVCRSRKAGRAMREVGRLDYKKVMESRFTLMKVRFVITVRKGSATKV